MSETWRSRVTITLGRSGQVVKRDASISDFDVADSHSETGARRSVRDRLGDNGDMWNGAQLNNSKRKRGESSAGSLSYNGLNDAWIGKDDLRLKLMRKDAARRAQSDDESKQMDLRQKLVKRLRPPVLQQRPPEPKDMSISGRIPSSRNVDDSRHVETMRSSYSPWTLEHIRRRSPDGYQSTSMRRRSPDEYQSTSIRRISPDGYQSASIIRRSPDGFRSTSIRGMSPDGYQSTSIRGRSPDGYQSTSIRRRSPEGFQSNSIRRRSPEGFQSTSSSRDISPQRHDVEDLQRRSLSRTFDGSRSVPYMSNDIHANSRPLTSASSSFMSVTRSIMSTLPPPPKTAKSVLPLPPPPRPPILGQVPFASSIAQAKPYLQTNLTVESFLTSLGLGKYAVIFKAEEVDMAALKQMGENDLKEMGIPMGPRKKILLALLPHSKRQTS